MDLRNIKKLQKIYGVAELQKQIENGSIWKFEGSMGRFAMNMLECGVCFLGNEVTFDYYGSKIPNRQVVKEGTKGSRTNAIRFWTNIEEGDFEAEEFLSQNFSQS